MLIRKTTSYCQKCNCSHESRIEVRAQEIIAVEHCPLGDVEHVISNNADYYLNLLERFSARGSLVFPSSKFILNYIPITNACNFKCTVCGANAKYGTDADYLPQNEITERLRVIQKNGGYLVNFFGGEASLHPNILEVVAEAAHLNLNIGIATNALRMGQSREFVKQLKQAGLKRAALQFDSLKEDTLYKLGRNHLKSKLQAIDYCKEEGIKMGLNCTVSKANLEEIPDIMDFAIQQVPHVVNMSLLSMAPIGRHTQAAEHRVSVFREEMIEIILRKWEKYGVTLEDIVLLPTFLPLGISVHPDCGASLLMVKCGEDIFPLNRLIDLEKAFGLMGRETGQTMNLWIRVKLVGIILRSLRFGMIFTTLTFITRWLMGSKSSGILNFGLTNYKTIQFQDEEKIEQCSCVFYTSSGPIRGCHHFTRDEDFPGSAAFQQKHGVL